MPRKKKPLLKEKDTFKALDKTGDFAGVLMFCAKVREKPFGPHESGPIYYIIFTDGGSDWFTQEELNIDKKTIKPYSSGCGIDFYGMHG